MPEPTVGTIFETADRESLFARLDRLEASSTRLWGKMDPAQMLAHCAVAIELPLENPNRRQSIMGVLMGRFVRRRFLAEVPFPKSSPTDPAFVVSDRRDFEKERTRLRQAVERFAARGSAAAEGAMHTFFGRLSGAEWGRLIYKHLDHHLRQFDR